MSRTIWCVAMGIAMLWSALPARAVFDINIIFQPSLTADQRVAFTNAEQFWESKITGYQPGVSLTGINITALATTIDGAGNQIGSGGVGGTVFQAGYTLPTSGTMSFDTVDIPTLQNLGVWEYVIIHEMAHVLGFGTLWNQNNLVQVVPDLGGPVPDKYIGFHGVNAYRQEWVPGATFVPVEDEGDVGTRGKHWNEALNGAAFTNITLVGDPSKDFAYELMTGWLNYVRYPPIISQTTVQSFRDMGYMTVPFDHSVIPEPSTYGLLLIALAGGLFLRRRKGC